MEKCEHCGHPTHKLDNWDDDWDYELVLGANGVVVERLSGEHRSIRGFQLCWKPGFMHIPTDNQVHANKAAALFVELYLRGFSASFADKIMDGYLFYLEALER